MTGISVIICTFNGRDRIGRTLEHLAVQDLQANQWELILVDNLSTDGTAEFAQEKWQLLNPGVQLKILEEHRAGKNNALELGFSESNFDYLVICDDDNWLTSNYLSMGLKIMEEHPDYGIVGGRAEAVADTELPDWFYENQYAYACGSPYNGSMDFTGIGMLWGAGMVIRRNVAQKIMHPKCPTNLSGRKGTELTAGEDDEKCVRTWLLGYKTFFDYRLLLWHYIPAYRLNVEYMEKLKNGFSDQGALIAAYRRTYEFRNHKKLMHEWWYQLPSWLFSKVSGNSTKARIAQEYLFLATGTKFWRTEPMNEVMNFLQFVESDE